MSEMLSICRGGGLACEGPRGAPVAAQLDGGGDWPPGDQGRRRSTSRPRCDGVRDPSMEGGKGAQGRTERVCREDVMMQLGHFL